MKVDEAPVIVEEVFKHPKSVVWKAISDHSEMVKWYFDNIPDFKAEVGFTTQFNVQAPSRDFLHIWKVTQVDPKNKLVYNWTFENIKGSADVYFELYSEDEQTKLVVTNKVITDFEEGIPEFERSSCLAGWNFFIKERLKPYLDS